MRIGIIGWGVVGQTVGRGFSSKNTVVWYDKYKEGEWSLEDVIKNSEIIFICVPTPMYEDFSGQDTSLIENLIAEIAPQVENTEKIVAIKSTVLPGTTKKLQEKFPNIKLAMNPEFLTEKQPDLDFANPDRTIIGSNSEEVNNKIRDLYLTIYPHDAKFFLTDSTTAELAKYCANVLLGAKIIIANEFASMAKALNVNYDDVREMVQADPRMGGHMKVPGHDGDAGFGGKCLPKDTVGFLQSGRDLGVDLSVIQAVWDKNLKLRKNYDWEKIEGATAKVEKVDKAMPVGRQVE